MSWLPLVRRHDALELLPRLELCDLNEANSLQAGTVVMLGWYLGDRVEPVQVRIERYALSAYKGRTLRGLEVHFHAANVLRVLWRPR